VRRLLLIALACAGCGRYGFRDAPDAMPDGPPDAMPDAGMCGAGYTLQPMGQLSHYRIGGPDTWNNAEHACEADGYGAHLVVFDNSLEMNANEDIATAFGSMAFWVGLSDQVIDGAFLRVIGGVPTFLPSWASGMPTLAGPGCVEFDPNARTIQDLSCGLAAYYICECDGVPVQPAAY
jgi:hypothetical protein